MLTVYHLGRSQSERIPWLCEELAIPYAFKRYDRDPVSGQGAPIFKTAHPMGAAPFITDGDVTLAESGAIMDYIMAKHGSGDLVPGPQDANFADYLYWYHFANGTFQPRIMTNLIGTMTGSGQDHPLWRMMREREDAAYRMVEDRLAHVPYLAGNAFTAADIMNFFLLTTARTFNKRALGDAPHTRAYLKRVGNRPAYLRAMAAGDPDLPLQLD